MRPAGGFFERTSIRTTGCRFLREGQVLFPLCNGINQVCCRLLLAIKYCARPPKSNSSTTHTTLMHPIFVGLSSIYNVLMMIMIDGGGIRPGCLQTIQIELDPHSIDIVFVRRAPGLCKDVICQCFSCRSKGCSSVL